MSETRAAYNVVMSHPELHPELIEGQVEGQPGRELDALVARVMGWVDIDGQLVPNDPDSIAQWEDRHRPDWVRAYSTDSAAAMEAWAWLEDNNPWSHRLVLGRDYINDKPSVGGVSDDVTFFVTGTTYPHAIALAVVEAGKALGVI